MKNSRTDGVFGYFFALLLACLGSLHALAESVPAVEVFKVGAILPLSGQSASLGNYIKNGLELAYQQLPSQQKAQVQLLIEDDGWQVPRSVSAYRKLVDLEHVKAVLVAGSAVGNAIAPLAEKDKVIMISIGASDAKVSRGRAFSFIHWVIPEVEARAMVEEIKRRDYKRLAIITGEQEGIIAVYNAVLDKLKEAGLARRVVLDERYLTTHLDFKTYVAKARAKNVDGIIICLFPGAISAFARQVREGGAKADLMGIELFEDQHEVESAGGALEGQWYVNADSAAAGFEDDYRITYGEHPGWSAANAFDSMNLLARGMEQTGPDTGALAHFLSTVRDYSGASGRYSATGDNRFTLPAAIKVVRKGGFEKLR